MTSTTEASNLSTQAIQKYAETVADHYGIHGASGSADLDTLLDKLGGRVKYSDGPEALHVDGPGNFDVSIPSFTSARRDRFTLAHELGHYFLHYLYPKVEGPKSFARGDRNRAETQANVFASSLLMPEAKYTAAFKKYDGDIMSLAVHFDVSPDAARVRASVLGLS